MICKYSSSDNKQLLNILIACNSTKIHSFRQLLIQQISIKDLLSTMLLVDRLQQNAEHRHNYVLCHHYVLLVLECYQLTTWVSSPMNKYKDANLNYQCSIAWNGTYTREYILNTTTTRYLYFISKSTISRKKKWQKYSFQYMQPYIHCRIIYNQRPGG